MDRDQSRRRDAPAAIIMTPLAFVSACCPGRRHGGRPTPATPSAPGHRRMLGRRRWRCCDVPSSSTCSESVRAAAPQEEGARRAGRGSHPPLPAPDRRGLTCAAWPFCSSLALRLHDGAELRRGTRRGAAASATNRRDTATRRCAWWDAVGDRARRTGSTRASHNLTSDSPLQTSSRRPPC